MEAFLVGWSRLAWGAWRQQHYHTLPRCSSARYSTALKVAGGSGKDGRDHILVVTGESERESHRTGTLLAEASASNKGASVRGGRSSQNERSRREPGIPRTEKMEVDQDWTSVYPAAAAFKPSAVPLPIRMGYPVKRGVPPVKDGNLELVKIPNFLHLTPVAIRKHCAALKDFCTEWPTVLNNEEKCMQHFPIEVDTVDYVSAGPSVRNPKARVVTLRIKLSSLNLDDHAKKKLIKLLGERYSKGTDTLTITTDRCPLRRQNYDYAVYLLTVLFHESWKTEQWEKDKTEADMEEYVWENSASEKNALDTLLRIRSVEKAEEVGREELLASEIILSYKNAIVALRNEGENEKSLSQYKNSVKKLLNINSL